MESLKIIVSLDSRTAIRLGQAQAGETAYPLAGVLPLLTDEQRDWLAAHVRSNYRQGDDGLSILLLAAGSPNALALTAPPTDDVVAAAIAGLIDAEAKADAASAAKSEARIMEALAASDADWLCAGIDGPGNVYYVRGNGEVGDTDSGGRVLRPRVDTSPRGIYLDDSQKADPRIATRRAEVETNALPAAVAAWEAKYAEWQAACEARKAREAEEAAAKEAAKEATRTWAASCEQLPTRIRRAAADGLDVYPALKRHLGDAVRGCLLEIVDALRGDIVDTYGTPQTSDRVPSDEAYAILDALTEAKPLIAAEALVPGVEVTVGPFVRVDVTDERKSIWRSAVDVAVCHPWFGDLGSYVLTEPVNLPDTDDDE